MISQEVATAQDFQQALDQVQAAIAHFVTGEADAYKACWSRGDDVTIFGAWGAYEQGWQEVDPRLDWAAARFKGGSMTFELLSEGWSGHTGYSIWLEKDNARLEGEEEANPFVLRVTHLYRREEGQWRIIHRHADAIVDRIAAGAILPQP